MYTARFLFTIISLVAAMLVAAGAAVFHWATFGRPDAFESPGIALGLTLVLMGGAAIVGAGQRLEGHSLRVDGIVIGMLGFLLAVLGRIAAAGITSTSGTLVATLLMTCGAYLIALGVRRFWPAVFVALVTVPFLRVGEYAPLMGMPTVGWIAGATVALTTRELRRMPVARVGILMSSVAAALLIALPAASAESFFSSRWLALFASLLWLAGWAFAGFAVLEKWPAVPLMVATACILLGPVLEGPIPIEEGWRPTLYMVLMTGLVVPGLTAATYLIGAFFGARVVLPQEPKGIPQPSQPQP
jgi:hypothetical protein